MRWWIGRSSGEACVVRMAQLSSNVAVGQAGAAPEAGEGEGLAGGEGDEEGARWAGAGLLPLVEAGGRDQAAALLERVTEHRLLGRGLGAGVDLAGGVVRLLHPGAEQAPAREGGLRGRPPRGPDDGDRRSGVTFQLWPKASGGSQAKACWNCRGSIESAKRPHMAHTLLRSARQQSAATTATGLPGHAGSSPAAPDACRSSPPAMRAWRSAATCHIGIRGVAVRLAADDGRCIRASPVAAASSPDRTGRRPGQMPRNGTLDLRDGAMAARRAGHRRRRQSPSGRPGQGRSRERRWWRRPGRTPRPYRLGGRRSVGVLAEQTLADDVAAQDDRTGHGPAGRGRGPPPAWTCRCRSGRRRRAGRAAAAPAPAASAR